MQVKIYCLYDPKECKVRYIGRTKKPIGIRLCEHISKSRYYEIYHPGKIVPHRVSWVKKLLNEGREPKIKLLKIVEGWSESHTKEREIIACHKIKRDLTNWEDRGDGSFNHRVLEESKKLISSTLKKGYKSGFIKSSTIKNVYIFNRSGKLVHTAAGNREAAKYLKSTEECVKKKVWRKNRILSINGYYISRSTIFTSTLPYIFDLKNNKKFYYDSKKQIIETYNLTRYIYESLEKSAYEYDGILINNIIKKGIFKKETWIKKI